MKGKEDQRMNDPLLKIENLVIDTEQHVVLYNDEPIDLPHKEYSLLHLLVTNLSKAISRDSILYRVWGDDFFGDDRVVDVHICRLREKLDVNLAREGRTELAQQCFNFLPTRAILDIVGWPEFDIFAH